jgi:hypothetical protein
VGWTPARRDRKVSQLSSVIARRLLALTLGTLLNTRAHSSFTTARSR